MYYGVARILLPIEENDVGRDTIIHAIDLAEHYRAALHVVSIVDMESSSDSDVRAEAFDAGTRSVLDDVIARTAQTEVPTLAIVLAVGSPAHVVRHYAVEHDIDCLVTGPTDHAQLSASLES